jgi:hypothetical protein
MQDCVGPGLRPGRAAQGPQLYPAEARVPASPSPHPKRQPANFHHFHYRPPLETPAEARDIVLECCLKENGNKFDLHTARWSCQIMPISG